jgi:hypothetical protein
VNRRLLSLKSPSLLCLLLVTGMLVPLSSVQAIFVENAGFETDTIPTANDEYAITPFTATQHLPGWTYYNPDDLDYLIGSYTPSAGEEYDSPSPPVNGQIMYIDINPSNQVGNGTKPVGFEQALSSATLQAGTYDLSVAVGNPQTFGFKYDGFGGYGIELIAGFTVDDTKPDPAGNLGDTLPNYINQLDGDTVLGSATGSLDNDGTPIGEGKFATISFSVDIPGDHALLGAALGIRLYNLNLDLFDAEGKPVIAASGIGFDNVTLSLSPVPVPAAVWLFGSALLGLAGFNWRRKRAA